MSSPLDLALLVGAAVLLFAVAAVRLSARVGLPSLVVYLLLGVALGEAGLGIQFENVELTRMLGFAALVLIIFVMVLNLAARLIARLFAPKTSGR